MTRRTLLQTAVLAAAPLRAAKYPNRKGVIISDLPKIGSWKDRLSLAKEVGFQILEVPTQPDPKEAEAIKLAADAVGLPIGSVMNSDHWKYPLSSSDPEVRRKCKEGMKTSLDNAKLWGASTVLLVPAVVNAQTPYNFAWDTSTREIREMIPWAAERKVVIGIEEVWNKFLYSPREFAAYVDQFQSPWVKAYFDVGNCFIFGFPQDWIRTLGQRIVKVHFKDFKFQQDPTIKKRVPEFVKLRQGELNWPEIMKALDEVGYKDAVTIEIGGGDLAFFQEASKSVDMILNGE